PKRDQGVDAAGGDADEEDLDEVARALGEVDDEPEDQHSDECRAQHADHAGPTRGDAGQNGGRRVRSHRFAGVSGSGDLLFNSEASCPRGRWLYDFGPTKESRRATLSRRATEVSPPRPPLVV